MSVINHFTKKITVLDYRGHLHSRNDASLRQIDAYFNNKRRKQAPSTFSTIKSILVTDHAMSRWNERVGPIMDKASLEQALTSRYWCFSLTENEGVIDDDIIFTFKMDENGSLVITTFYGRRSLNFLLNQFSELRNYNKYYEEKIDLSIPIETLEKQILPPIPCETMTFKGNWTKYYVEKYADDSSTLLFIHVLCGDNCGDIIKIDVNLPPISKLSKSTLRALHLMGYSEYVYQYISLFKESQLQNYLRKQQLRISA